MVKGIKKASTKKSSTFTVNGTFDDVISASVSNVGAAKAKSKGQKK